MKHLLGILSLSFVTAAGIAACGSNSSSGPEKCDIPRLFEQCSGRVCHQGDDPAGGLDLDAANVDNRLFGIPGSEDCDHAILVEPGYPGRSLLYEKLTSEKPSCGRPMPPRGSLTSFELGCVKEYIEKAKGLPSCETCGDVICVDLQTDERNCGACGTPCGTGMQCAEGACINPCDAGTTLCGSECANTKTDAKNCGACGHVCAAGTTCVEGSCACDADLPAVTFAGDILPIVKASCGGDDCHTEGDSITTLDLSPAKAYAALVEAESDGCEGRTRVVPGNPNDSYLVEKISGGPVCSGKRMPIFADTLPDPVQLKLSAWICQGAKND